MVSDDFFLGPPSLGLPTISSLLPSRGQPSGTSHGGCQSGGSEVLGDQGAPAVWYNNVQYVFLRYIGERRVSLRGFFRFYFFRRRLGVESRLDESTPWRQLRSLNWNELCRFNQVDWTWPTGC